MRRSKQYHLRNVADTYFLYPSGEADKNEHKLIFLNETSAFLWQKMEDCCEVDYLVDMLMAKYNINVDIASEDVSNFIKFLVNNGCID